MKNPEDVEHFRLHFSRIFRQESTNDTEFLLLCKEACSLVWAHWEDREIIADRMASVVMRHEKTLSLMVRNIGYEFAWLELPDEHVYLEEGQTVKSLWQDLGVVVEAALDYLKQSQSMELKT